MGAGPDRKGAFFGRRKGRRLRPRQADLFNTLLPQLALDLGTPAPRLEALFPGTVDEIRLEIGFGSGEHLVQQAQNHPHIGFIGVEQFANGMAKMLRALKMQKRTNVRLHHGDATEVLAWLPVDSVTCVDLLYPDPWPKRRHWKRRFIQQHSVSEIGRVLRPFGEFRFATDIADYAAWTLQHMTRSPCFTWTAESAQDWRQPWRGFAETRYEAKAKRSGRQPCYLVFRKIKHEM
jgi:tRNA (guanine-N7-)-methyltransferase